MTQLLVRIIGEKPRKVMVIERAAHPDWFSSQLNGKSFIMENSGETLVFVASLMKRYPRDVAVYAIDEIVKSDIPKKYIKAGEWLAEPRRGGRKIEDAIRRTGLSKEGLVRCRIYFKRDWKRMEQESSETRVD